MAQKVVLKRSTVPGKVPLVGDLVLGELAINTADGKLYIKKNDGTESIIEIDDKLNGYSASDFQLRSEKGSANGYAALDANGKLQTSQIPALSINTVHVVSSNTEMINLLTTTQEGDIVVRTDISQTFIRSSGETGTLSDWIFMPTPLDTVLSVNGYVGAVVLTTTHIDEGTNKYYLDSRVYDYVTQSMINDGAISTTGLWSSAQITSFTIDGGTY